LLTDATKQLDDFLRASDELMDVSESDIMKESVAHLATQMQERHSTLQTQLASNLASLRLANI